MEKRSSPCSSQFNVKTLPITVSHAASTTGYTDASLLSKCATTSSTMNEITQRQPFAIIVDQTSSLRTLG